MSGYSHYGGPGLSTTQPPQLTSIANLSRPQDSPGSSLNLPPINSQFAGHPYPPANVKQPYGSAPHTPHTPGTPLQNGYGHSNGYQPSSVPSSAAGQSNHSYAPSMPPFSNISSAGSYGTAPPQPNSVNGSQNYPQQQLPSIQPAVLGSESRGPYQSYGNGQPAQGQGPDVKGEARLMPVVGSQGRRGILPSAQGRAPPIGSALDGSQRPGQTPIKNADGKYPCMWCNKTYLHLKHLKRHHLRHTGERPYQCCLCQETFCRSDILKRHFAKCSIRRGNPTGATHLTHAQAHLKGHGNNGAKIGATGPEPQPMPPAGGPPSSYRGSWTNGNAFPHYGGDASHLHNGMPGESTQSSRSSSIMRPGSSSDEDIKKRFSAPTTLAPMSMGIEQNGDRGFPNYAFNQDRYPPPQAQQAQQHAQQPPQHREPQNPYGGNAGAHMSYPGQNEQSYMRPGFPPYHPTSGPPMHQESWASAFQPGAQDTMMYTGQ